jgi:NAD(P) transhydrogenase subunit alpha
MKIGIPRESRALERRVAATPDTITKLQKLGYTVSVEAGAGVASNFPDAAYEAVGAEIVDDTRALWEGSDLILKVNAPGPREDLGCHEADLLTEGTCLISFLWPAQNEALVARLAKGKVTTFAMDAVPRTSRAQKMDALSSMANIAGYRAVLEAAAHFGSFFTQQITAAGKLPPARVLVIGAGVAGLSAIASARGLGAVVRAFDTRPVVKEQVESLGAEFLELQFEEDGTGQGGYAKVMSEEFIAAEMALFLEQAPEVDIVVTTALIPGKKAPLLWNQEAVEAMKPGSVVVDLAAEQGGNCACTKPGEIVKHAGVTIVGLTDLTSRLPTTASQLYGTNIVHLLSDMGDADSFHIDHDNREVRGALITQAGEVMWPPPKVEEPAGAKAPTAAPPAPAAAAAPVSAPVEETPASSGPKVGFSPLTLIVGLGLLGVWLWLKFTTGNDPSALTGETPKFLQHLTVFVLSVFVGWQVIWNVTAALHTPLMSVTNAISGIIIIGGILGASQDMEPSTVLAMVAVFFAMINVAGGFLVTERMLKMFRK